MGVTTVTLWWKCLLVVNTMTIFHGRTESTHEVSGKRWVRSFSRCMGEVSDAYVCGPSEFQPQPVRDFPPSYLLGHTLLHFLDLLLRQMVLIRTILWRLTSTKATVVRNDVPVIKLSVLSIWKYIPQLYLLLLISGWNMDTNGIKLKQDDAIETILCAWSFIRMTYADIARGRMKILLLVYHIHPAFRGNTQTYITKQTTSVTG